MVTDDRYGVTLDIFECKLCFFRFCPTKKNLIENYEKMEDNQYVETSVERKLQANELFTKIKRFLTEDVVETLDVGCGSGLFVETLRSNGFSASGVEPSKALSDYALGLGINVINGQVQDIPTDQKFDFISLVDVIEHVDDPNTLVYQLSECLKPNGLLLLVTPRTDSFFHRVLGLKWWHYRLAHVGYFSKKNLSCLLKQNSFDEILSFSPSWYFSLPYLIERIFRYVPGMSGRKVKHFKNRVVRLNLGDSIAMLARKNDKLY
jgi:2-polyprenyl-3-methyl-5-hydroxy-6-metoxy-1,4-benzoquinol methylase